MSAIEEITIRSLGKLLDQVTPSKKHSAIGRRRDNAVYRGLENAEWDLLTSLDRLSGPTSPHGKANLEPSRSPQLYSVIKSVFAPAASLRLGASRYCPASWRSDPFA